MKRYNKIFIDISPGFYKTKLLCEIANEKDILVIYTSDYDCSTRNKDFLSGVRNYPHVVLEGNVIIMFLRLLYILLTTRYDECIVGGYVTLSDWIPIMFCSKKKNSIILESTYRETVIKGIRVCFKKLFFKRVNRVYACGMPHEKLARMFGFKGEVVHINGVGLINLVGQPEFMHRDEVKKFLFVGRLIWQKNLKWLIDRFRCHPELELSIVGFGPDRDMLLSYVSDCPNIKFLGTVENKCLPKYYKEADVFILPSVSETWGVVVEEALNNGTPVMVSNMVGASDDLVKALNTGVVFEIGNIGDFEDKLGYITDISNYNSFRKNICSIDFAKREQEKVNSFLK